MTLGIIGGSGLTRLRDLEVKEHRVMRTPYGEPSAPMAYGVLGGRTVIFLPRHGAGHTIPPHRINYQANVWALRECGVTHVIAAAAVGAIEEALTPGSLALPDQIIDYTFGRAHTYFADVQRPVTHIDFSEPYCQELRQLIGAAASRCGVSLRMGGTYAATQGPRFETAAEIRRLERDGATMVGMTGMPEAALARELGLCYATIAVSANAAAGKQPGPLRVVDIERILEQGMAQVRTLLGAVIPLLGD